MKRLSIFLASLLLTLIINSCANPPATNQNRAPIILGLDHIPLAVSDLDRAAETYRQLGFTLKPGREHQNGIQNQHIKFPDGTEIELITAHQAVDPLTSAYLEHLAQGDGPAFVGFYAPSIKELTDSFDADQRAYHDEGGLLTFPKSDPLGYILFGQRNQSSTDQPQHFEHPNSAEALIGVWIAADDLELERQLFTSLGANISQEEVQLPHSSFAIIARSPQADVLLLPASQQLVPGRRIIGATIRIDNLDIL